MRRAGEYAGQRTMHLTRQINTLNKKKGESVVEKIVCRYGTVYEHTIYIYIYIYAWDITIYAINNGLNLPVCTQPVPYNTATPPLWAQVGEDVSLPHIITLQQRDKGIRHY